MTYIAWFAALVGCLAHGTYAVPFKSSAANSVRAKSLVLQTYKTTVCFLTCWIVLLWRGRRALVVTPWGLLSGLLWVPGGTCGIYGVRNAGLAVSVALWSGVCVAVSFLWGLELLGERVHSLPTTVAGILLLLLGLTGMSVYSSSSSLSSASSSSSTLTEDEYGAAQNNEVEMQSDQAPMDDDENEDMSEVEAASYQRLSNGEDENNNNDNDSSPDQQDKEERNYILGVVGAIVDGLLRGTRFVPMYYSAEKGLDFVISFAVGAVLTNAAMWIAVIAVRRFQGAGSLRDVVLAIQGDFHLRTLAGPGLLAGVLWSIGNIANIVAVNLLGQGVGMAVSQGALVVSGLWGLFWYQELGGGSHLRIFLWCLAGLLTVGAIFLLGAEHIATTTKNH